MVFSTCYRDVLSGTPRKKNRNKKIKLPDQIRFILKHIYKGELTCRVLKKLAILLTLGIRIPDCYFFLTPILKRMLTNTFFGVLKLAWFANESKLKQIVQCSRRFITKESAITDPPNEI